MSRFLFRPAPARSEAVRPFDPNGRDEDELPAVRIDIDRMDAALASPRIEGCSSTDPEEIRQFILNAKPSEK